MRGELARAEAVLKRAASAEWAAYETARADVEASAADVSYNALEAADAALMLAAPAEYWAWMDAALGVSPMDRDGLSAERASADAALKRAAPDEYAEWRAYMNAPLSAERAGAPLSALA